MSRFLDPTNQPTYGIGICARCSRKFFLAQLMPDPNSPGLMVCEADRDVYDPYRLPQRMTEDISLPFVRPDDPMVNTYPYWTADSISIFADGSPLVWTADGFEPESYRD